MIHDLKDIVVMIVLVFVITMLRRERAETYKEDDS